MTLACTEYWKTLSLVTIASTRAPLHSAGDNRLPAAGDKQTLARRSGNVRMQYPGWWERLHFDIRVSVEGCVAVDREVPGAL